MNKMVRLIASQYRNVGCSVGEGVSVGVGVGVGVGLVF
jgi:hypothetical protein